VIICDYNSKASVEENYINTDIVLIFANANLETESWPEAVQNGFSSRDRAYSWLEEVGRSVTTYAGVHFGLRD
jgi:hypothetical protein